MVSPTSKYISFSLTLDMDKLNYDAWHKLFETHCFSFGVLGYLDGSSQPSGSTDTKCGELESIVRISLYDTISQDLLQMIPKKNTSAQDVWVNLENLVRANN